MTDLYGCGDHGCIYGHPGGMGTNGGCNCLRDLIRAAGDDGRKAIRQITELRRERNQLHAQLAEAVEALKEVVDAADGKGWEQLDPMLKKQRAVLAKAMRVSHES